MQEKGHGCVRQPCVRALEVSPGEDEAPLCRSVVTRVAEVGHGCYQVGFESIPIAWSSGSARTGIAAYWLRRSTGGLGRR